MNTSFAQILPYKRIGILLTSLLAVFFLFAPGRVSADDLNTKNQLCTGANLTFKNQGCNVNAAGQPVDDANTAESKINKLVIDVINIISVIAGVAAVIMVIYGGFRFVTSGGNAESTRAARNAILYALIGLVIIAFAQLIVKFVLSKAVGVTS